MMPMDTHPHTVLPHGNLGQQTGSAPAPILGVWQSNRGRMIGGLLLVLPILITLWLIGWAHHLAFLRSDSKNARLWTPFRTSLAHSSLSWRGPSRRSRLSCSLDRDSRAKEVLYGLGSYLSRGVSSSYFN